MSDLISKASALEIINNRIRNRKHTEDSVWTRNDEAIDIQFAIENLPVYREMNCIKDGKYTGDSCFGCSVKVKDCEIRDRVYRRRWIPVSERLPDKEGEYLCTALCGSVTDIWIDTFHEGAWVIPVDVDFEYEIIAWQPLPEPWKGDKDIEN